MMVLVMMMVTMMMSFGFTKISAFDNMRENAWNRKIVGKADAEITEEAVLCPDVV